MKAKISLTVSPLTSVAAFAVAYVVLSYLRSFIRRRSRQKGRPLPPGPTPLPVIGNPLDMPRSQPWLAFRSLCAKYGDLVYLNVLGGHVVVIGSASAARELLEKRSANTSDRPPIVVLPLIGNNVSFSLMPYGQRWRDHRRAFWHVFHPEAIRSYRETERSFVLDFLRNLVDSPEDLSEHIRDVFAAMILKIMYDLDAQEDGGELVERIHYAVDHTSSLLVQKHAVEFLPALRHLPAWVPGAGFQRIFAKCKAAIAYAKETPFAKLKASLDAGEPSPCAVATLLSGLESEPGSTKYDYEEDVIKNVGVVAFEGGADTSFSTLQAVFVAMSLYPEVLRKAQAELDAVVGPHRLPDFDDRDALVYMNALLKEAMRWHVVVPVSPPHSTLEDEVIDGYFIPAGTTLLTNAWAILHDPAVYEDPEEFRPERFIRDGTLDPTVPDPYLHGDFVHLDVLGDHIVLVGSASKARELLEKRSANTSDRPRSTVSPLIGSDVTLGLMPYGQLWRDHRRAFWQVFHPGAIRGYREAERVLLLDFLRNLVASPEDLDEHIRYVFAATILKVLYDFDAQEDGGELIERIHYAVEYSTALLVKKHAIDFLPALRHLPAWLPGAGFQRTFAKCKAALVYAKETPFEKLKASLGTGGTSSCAIAILLSRLSSEPGSPEYAYEEDVVKNVAVSAFEGGADTSYSTFQAVLLAMSLYPEVLRKAQAELDAVVGPHRLPDYDDRASLVYINAILKEAVRWHVLVPLSAPHSTLEDEVIDGYFIPAGTTLFENIWAILHDPVAYEDPEEFRPERFIKDGALDPTVRDPYLYAFGSGRRICPGRHFADDSLYITIASVLHVFDIGPPLDEDGQPIKIEYEVTGEFIVHPTDSRCTVKPRSEQARSLIYEA